MTNPTNIETLEELRQFLSSRDVSVVAFHRNDNAQSQQTRSTLRSLPGNSKYMQGFRFAEVDAETHEDICQAYRVTTIPTILIHTQGLLLSQLEGDRCDRARHILDSWTQQQLAGDGEEEADGKATIGDRLWNGAELPRGYGDITEQVEARGCELLNADESAGPVRVLFDKAAPRALGSGEGVSSQDFVQSGSDDQLLLFVPLHSTVKLHTLQITSLPPKDQTDVSRPKEIRIFMNRIQNMDFDEAENADPAQTVTLTESDWNKNGTASIGLRFVKFIKTSSLVIFVQSGEDDAESVRIDRVRLIGEAGVVRKMQKLQKVGDE